VREIWCSSNTLRSLLVAARKRDESDAARAPDEKPSFAEGDLVSRLFEGPDGGQWDFASKGTLWSSLVAALNTSP